MPLIALVAHPVGEPFQAWVYFDKHNRGDIRCNGPERICIKGIRTHPKFPDQPKWHIQVSDGDVDIPVGRVDSSNSWDWGGCGEVYFFYLDESASN
jgi:hypothetical protein